MADTYPKKPSDCIVALDRHEGVFLITIFPPLLSIGVAWHAGFAKEGWSTSHGTNGWNDDVLAAGSPLPSVCNKVSKCIVPHLNMFPFPPWSPNLFIPILIYSSASKNFMGVGSVICRKGPVSVRIPGVKVVGANLACNDPYELPTNIVAGVPSTVILGFTVGDLVAAAAQWGLDVLIAAAKKKIFKALSGGKSDKGPLGFLKKKLTAKLDQLGVKVGEGTAEELEKAAGKIVDKAVSVPKSIGTSQLKNLYHDVFPSDPTSPSLPQRLGALIDGRSEDIPTMDP